MDKKIVFFDIDGTIWDFSGMIPNSARTAIKQLKENGHIPVICTGRAKGHVRDEKLLNLGFDGMIAACGAHVEFKEKILYESFLPDEIVREIVELSEAYRVPIVLEGTVKHWISPWGFEHDDFVDRMYEIMGEDAINIDGYNPDMKANKFSGDIIDASDYTSFRREIEKNLEIIDHILTSDQKKGQDKFADANRVIGVFEGVTRGITKATGMKCLCDYLNVDIKDTIAIGDSNNDIEMINAAGIGIAMGSGSDKIKENADYITDDLWDDGLRNALEHFGLI